MREDGLRVSKQVPVLLAILALAGCGGGGGNSPSSGGSGGNGQPSDPDRQSVVLRGLVTDSVLAHGQICAYQGSVELLCAETDASGAYELVLAEGLAPEEAVLLVATKTTDRGLVKLTSNLGYASSLPEGDMLDTESLPDLAVTNLTTVRELLVEEGEHSNIHQLYTLDELSGSQEAVDALARVVKDLVDEMLTETSSFSAPDIDAYEVARQITAQVRAAISEDPEVDVVAVARQARDVLLGAAAGTLTNQGDQLEQSEAYQLSLRPHINNSHWFGTNADSELALLTFSANAMPQLWIDGQQSDEVGAQQASASWDNIAKNWVITLADGIAMTGIRSELSLDDYTFKPLANVRSDDLAGWYFLEKRIRDEGYIGSTYGAVHFHADGNFSRYQEAMTHNTAGGWDWWNLASPTQLGAVESTGSWDFNRGMVEIEGARLFRMANDEDGLWKFLQLEGTELTELVLLPWLKAIDTNSSFLPELLDLAESSDGYAMLQLYGEEDYFGWSAFIHDGEMVTACSFYPGDAGNLDEPECDSEISAVSGASNAIQLSYLDMDYPESFNLYMIDGSLNGRSRFIEDKISCGDEVCQADEESSNRWGMSARVYPVLDQYRTFSWERDIISGKALELVVIADGEAAPFLLNFNALGEADTSNLVESLLIDGVHIPLAAAIFSGELDDRLGTGFIRLELASAADILGKFNIGYIYLMLHSRDATNPKISVLPVTASESGDSLFEQNSSIVDAAGRLY